jgi:hypothetical protein
MRVRLAPAARLRADSLSVLFRLLDTLARLVGLSIERASRVVSSWRACALVDLMIVTLTCAYGLDVPRYPVG